VPGTGRFPANAPPEKIHGSNLPVSVLGALILWFGWFGFNGGSTLTLNQQVATIIVDTVLAGVGGMIASLVIGWITRGIPDVELLINGSLAGLVGITASCHAVTASSSVVIGVIAAVVAIAIDGLLVKCRIDDAVGAIPVHLGAGIWGTIAVALFGKPELLATGLSRIEQLEVQVLGVISCFILAFGLAI
jgi:Amt family ammonium transporter